MVYIYEKVCKTKENIYGIKQIKRENPLKKGPCIITIIAVPRKLKDINAMLRQTAYLVNPDIDNNYDKDRRILGLGFGKYNEETSTFSQKAPKKEEVEDFIDKYFKPLFIENGKKVDMLTAMKNFRNLTFITYCNGARTFVDIEDCLYKKLIEHYTKTETGMILSQICLAALTGNVIQHEGSRTLALSFGDIQDDKYDGCYNSSFKIINNGKAFVNCGDTLTLATSHSKEHSLYRYMTGDPILSPRISLFVNTSVNNSIENKYNEIINPITYEKIDKEFRKLDEQEEKIMTMKL